MAFNIHRYHYDVGIRFGAWGVTLWEIKWLISVATLLHALPYYTNSRSATEIVYGYYAIPLSFTRTK